MTIEENTAPAGDSESEVIPTPAALSEDEADAKLFALDEGEPSSDGVKDGDNTANADEEPATAQATDESEAVASETPADPNAPEGEAGTEINPEPELQEFDKLDGNTRLRLRDGTEITVGDVKKNWGGLQELEAARQEFEGQRHKFDAERQQFQQWADQRSQEANQFQQVAPQAIAALQNQLREVPPMPDGQLFEDDFVEYQRQVNVINIIERENNAIFQQQQQIAQQNQQITNHQNQEREAQNNQYIQSQRQKLEHIMPGLSDPVKKQEFANDYMNYGQEWGFSPDELSQTHDARMILVIDKAMKWDKLQANPPTPTKKATEVATTPAKPGKMVTPMDAKQHETAKLFERANKQGSISGDDALHLLAALEN